MTLKEPTLSWLTAALRSSVGKKFVMGITGLFLCFFLVIHLAGNLLLYVGDGQVYNDYAHKLHANEAFLVVAEVFLFAAFIAHVYLAFATNRENAGARGVAYEVQQSKRDDRTVNIFGWTPDTTMFVTGAVVLVFLIVHLTDFKFGDIVHGDALAGLEPYEKARLLMGDLLREAIYLVGSLFLGVHVAHGFASAFQSLGLNHPKYNGCIRKSAVGFAILVAVGFGSFSFWGAGGLSDVSSDDARSASFGSEAPAPRPDEYDQM